MIEVMVETTVVGTTGLVTVLTGHFKVALMQMQLVIGPTVPLLLFELIKLQERLANAKPTVNAPKSISQVSQLKAHQRLNCGMFFFWRV